MPFGEGAHAVDRSEVSDRPIAIDRFTTAAVPVADQYRCWKEQIAGIFVGLDATRSPQDGERSAFHVEVARRSVGLDAGAHLDFIEATSDAQSVARSHRLIRKADAEWLLLAVQLAGTSVLEESGESLLLGPGDMILLDAARPYRLRFPGRFRHLVVKIPSNRLVPRLPRAPGWLWRPVSASSPMGSVLAAHLGAVVPALDAVDPAMRPVLMERTMDLIALTFAGALREYGGAGSTVRQALVARARSVVEARLADPALTAGTIAGALGISQGYLHRLFREAGTSIGGYVRDSRFQRARADLADPMQAGASVTEIAMRWGFNDMPHFSRAFRRRFGVSPRDYRSAVLTRLPVR